MARPHLTPCIICEKAVLYLWKEKIVNNESPTNLDGACDVTIFASYGSIFDMNEYAGIICDDCIDKLVQSRRLRFVKEHGHSH
jgi:hypothetical protein